MAVSGMHIFGYGVNALLHENRRKNIRKTKLLANQERDDRVIRLLQEAGWECLVIWECELSNYTYIREKLIQFLEPNSI